MKQANFARGRQGEQLASKYLVNKGYRVLSQNFRTRFGEIDIVCTDGVVLIFVEVKLKVGENFGTPEEMITTIKLQQVARTAEAFNVSNPEISKLYPLRRIDVVAIVLGQEGEIKRITHYENVGAEV